MGLSSGKRNERTWHLTTLKLTSMVGFILGCVTLNTGARMLAAFLFVGANYGVTSITLGWVGITCAQTKEKRAAALATVNTCASVSQIWAPVSKIPSHVCRETQKRVCTNDEIAHFCNSTNSTFGRIVPLLATSSRSLPARVCVWLVCCVSGRCGSPCGGRIGGYGGRM